MNCLLAKVKTGTRTPIFRKILSNKEIYKLPENLNTSVNYNPSTLLEDDEWYKIENFSETTYFLEIMRSDFSSVNYDKLDEMLEEQIAGGTDAIIICGTTGESSTLEDDAVPGENDDRAFEKFDHVVEVHYGYQIDPKDTTLPDGDSVDNNQYTRYLLDNYNIKVVCDWTAGNTADFQQKVSLAIASASLPDAVIAPTRNYLVQAARADLLADLWPEFNQYASKQVKEIIETTEGRAINNATVDGTFCALPNVSVDTDGVYLYFIRQDWLDKLGLEVPKTVDELGEVAQKFKDAGLSPDYSIAGIDNGGRTYSNFMNSSNNGYGFDAVYQAFNATPGYFLKDDSGELYWGTTTDEMKEALTTLHDWYEKGLINPEVGTTTNGDNANNVKNGTCGIFMGPWWSLGYGNPDSFRNDNNANWQAYPLYTNDGVSYRIIKTGTEKHL